jgi:hypothetical protein
MKKMMMTVMLIMAFCNVLCDFQMHHDIGSMKIVCERASNGTSTKLYSHLLDADVKMMATIMKRL